MIQNYSMVLEALLSSGKEHASNIPAELLRKAYEIQVRYQFEKDTDIRIKEMARLVDDFLNQINDKRGQA